jgi:hypothetical protein
MRQRAEAVVNNRAINGRRADRRMNAGIAMLASVTITLVVVAFAVVASGH